MIQPFTYVSLKALQEQQKFSIKDQTTRTAKTPMSDYIWHQVWDQGDRLCSLLALRQ